jgi:hypothetical protein
LGALSVRGRSGTVGLGDSDSERDAPCALCRADPGGGRFADVDGSGSKSAEDQIREIEKLVADAARLLDQALYALATVRERLKPQSDEPPAG